MSGFSSTKLALAARFLFLFFFDRVGIEPMELMSWMENLRLWISQTVLVRLVAEVDETNKQLGKLGLKEVSFRIFFIKKRKKEIDIISSNFKPRFLSGVGWRGWPREGEEGGQAPPRPVRGADAPQAHSLLGADPASGLPGDQGTGVVSRRGHERLQVERGREA